MTAPSRRLAIGLLASVALNLFLGGLLAGTYLHREAEGPLLGRVGGPPPSLEWVRRALGPEVAPALDAVGARHGAALRQRTLELRDARRVVDRRLEAEAFDAAALTTALEEVGRRSATLQAQLATALVDLSGALTPEQRRRMVEARRNGFRIAPTRDEAR